MNLIPEPNFCLTNYPGFFKKIKLLLFPISGRKKKSTQNTQRGKCLFWYLFRKPFDMEKYRITSVASSHSPVIQITHANAWTCNPQKSRTNRLPVPLWTRPFCILSGNS